MGMTFLPDDLAPALLAPTLRPQLPNLWQAPGAAESLVEAALLLRRHELVPDDLTAIPPLWRPALAVTADQLQRHLRQTYDEVRLYRYAAARLPASVRGARVAFYGLFDLRPAQQELVAALVKQTTVTAWVPWTFSEDDLYADPWLALWEHLGARREMLPPAPSATVYAVPADRGLSAAVLGALTRGRAQHPQVEAWAVGAGTPETARAIAAALRRAGVPVRTDPAPPTVDERLRTSWAAAAPDASVEHVLAWLSVREAVTAPELRQAVVRSPDDPAAWPREVRRSWHELQRTGESLRRCLRWVEVPGRLRTFLDAAGIDWTLPADVLERVGGWDQAGLRPDPSTLAAWLLREGRITLEPGPGVWVTTAWELRGSNGQGLVLADVDDAHLAPAPEWEQGIAASWLDHRDPGRTVRRIRAPRHMRRLLSVQAEDIWVVAEQGATPDGLSPVGWVDPPATVRGEGLVVVRSRRQERFGPYDGWFGEGRLPRPTSVSGYELYGRCPLRYAFQQLGIVPWDDRAVEPEPTLVGLWAHSVLQRLAGNGEPPEGWHTAVVRALNDAAIAHPPDAGVAADLLAAVEDALAGDLTWILARDGGGWTGAFERPFRLESPAGPLAGRMDRVTREGNQLLVVDYKTGPLPSPRVGPDALQLPVYAWAASQVFDHPLEGVRAGYQGVTRRNAFRTVWLEDSSPTQWTRALDLLLGINERVDRGQAYAFPRAQACRTCDLRPACPFDAETDGRAKVRAEAQFGRLWDAVATEVGDVDAE